VLHILSKLQRTLDVLDIEGLSSLWREAKMVTNLSGEQPSVAGRTVAPDSLLESPIVPLGVDADVGPSGIPTISDWTEFLDIYLSPIDSRLNHLKPVPKDLHYFLLAYLLSATFKDCSIILRVDVLSLKGRPAKPVDPSRVTMIDLDPKSMDKLQKWEELDKEIVETYAGVDKPKRCIDSWFE
jgi:inositol-pentakisphosphate 2-kinase